MRLPPQVNERIDRSTNVQFAFNGKSIEAFDGDTIASALYASGMRIFSRSFKYHRPRGLLCGAGHCPNCLMNVDGVPNVRTCITPVREGVAVHHQNAWPSLNNDLLSVNDKLDFLMPVGFYYKTFTHPRVWKIAESVIRRAAGLGVVPEDGSSVVEHEYSHTHMHADIVVIGGGPAGMTAAIEAAKTGETVVLIDDGPALGGHLRWEVGGPENNAGLAGQLLAHSGINVLGNATCFGIYEGNLLGISQGERLIHLRGKRIVVATGCYEAPLVFENNDLPGVMLSSGAQQLIFLHSIKPGERAVVVGNEADSRSIVDVLRAADIDVMAIVAPDQVTAATGRKCVAGIQTTDRHIACDLIVVCGDRVPDAGLIGQAGGRLEWDEERGAFLPINLPPTVSAVGDVTNPCLNHRFQVPTTHSKKAFVCVCEDVTVKDLCKAIEEGFDHIETLKRYTTATMGPCQGKMCQLASIGVCASQTGRSIGETGRTTSRPPVPPVSLGALAGARHHPVKRTPLYHSHDALGCQWMDLGEWKRPHHYTSPDDEYQAVRECVGIIDVSTLGKLDVQGRDASRLLDKVYTNRLSNLQAGRVRYAVICDDAGIILDDGTVSRVNDNHYFITTTSGNIDFVDQWLDWWAEGTGWCVHVTDVTGGYASINVAGPKARNVLSKLTNVDLTTEAFPYMTFQEGEVARIPALLLRIGFVGETGWEIHVPAEYGEHLWDALMDAGAEFDIQPFGVEAQRMLRLDKKHIIVGVDTDATSNPIGADMAWVAKLDKEDFIGRSAILRAKRRDGREKLIGFVMDDDITPDDGAAIVVDGKPVGRVTSARFSPAKGRPLGLGWVPAGLDGDAIIIEVRGQQASAQIVTDPFYDPEGKRLRD